MKNQKIKIAMAFVAIFAALLSGCKKWCDSENQKKEISMEKSDYYKDGNFNQEAAKQAYISMMENLGYPISDNMRENFWASDFGLGEFPQVGMGGIFWVVDDKSGMFGHEILLLPNQLLIEHWHEKTDKLPAKFESWHCRAGRSYCFGEEGEDAAKYPEVKVHESQLKYITTNKVSVCDAKKGNIVWLNKVGARHYQIAGPQGAVVTEYGSFHAGEGTKFTNPNVKF